MMQIETRRGVMAYRHLNAQIDETPLLIIHGAGIDHHNWDAVCSYLTDRNLLLIDLLGHGASQTSGRDTIEGYVKDVLAFLDVLEIEQVMFVGHSMGGAIAQWLALHAPERVVSMVLVATNGELDVNPALIDGLRKNYMGMCATIAKWSCSDGVVREQIQEAMLKLPSEVTLNDYLACDQFHLLDQAHHIQIPTLILNGTADRMTPIECARRLRDALPNAQLIELDGGSHQIPLEMPEQVANEILRWFSQLS